MNSIDTTIEINGVDFEITVEFYYSPGFAGSFDEPPYDEEFEINEIVLTCIDPEKDISYLLSNEKFYESIIDLIKGEY